MNVPHLSAEVHKLWPGKLNEDQMHAITDAVSGIDLGTDQITAVCRAVFAEPAAMRTLQTRLVSRLREAARAAKWCDRAPTLVEPSALATMRRINNLPDASPLEVVCTEYRRAADLSVTLRGYVKPSWADDAVRDIMQYAGRGEAEAVAWAMRVAEGYPTEPGPEYPETDRQCWFVEMMARATNRKVAVACVVAGLQHNARPNRRAEARAVWLRMKAAGNVFDAERKAMAGIVAGVVEVGRKAGGEA